MVLESRLRSSHQFSVRISVNMNSVCLSAWIFVVIFASYHCWQVAAENNASSVCNPLKAVGCSCSASNKQADIRCGRSSTFTTPFPDLSHINGTTTTINLVISNRPVHVLPKSFFDRYFNVSTLHLQNANLRNIEDGLLEGLSAPALVLRLDGNQLREIPSGAFAKKDLYELDLRNNKFSEVPLIALQGARKVSKLIMDGNPLGGNGVRPLRAKAFDGLVDLYELSLSECGIREIERGAFNGLHNLLNLHLDKNLLEHIRSWYFLNLTRPDSSHQNKLNKLFLHHNKIADIDPGVFDQSTSNLKYIHLDHNKIRTLRKGVFKSMTLEELTLAHNELSTIEDRAFEDVWLKSGILDLSFNKLTTIGQHLFTGLKVTVKGTSSGPILRMDYCEIEEIETGAFDITTPFKELHMRYNHIRRLSASMFGGGDKALIAVTMDHNLLEFVPQLNATKLKLMSINDNQITQIRDEDLRVYTSLERLEIEKNPPLSFIHPNAFNGFKKLSVVKLAGGSLKALPIFKGATALGDIDASSNQLTSFPAEICTHCPNLYLLFLGGNRLTSLPQLGNCSILEYLHLHDNPIGNLPNDALEGNLHLRSIVLSNTSMTVLPPNLIKNKRRLTKLDVRRNGITEIPRAFFAEAFELRDLYLSHNRISVLGPGVFHNVSYLDNLEFTHNNLRYIDEEAWHNLTFHFLTKLNLSDNVELTHIPTPGDGFPHLKDLSLTNCPKLERVPPPEMTSRLVTAEYTYGYHCCLWTSQTHPNWMSKEKIEPWFDNIPIKNYGGKLETIPTPPRTSPTPVSSTTSTSPSFTVGTRDLLDVLLREYGAKTYGHNVTVTFSPFNPSTESPPVRIHPANSLKDFTCIPRVSQFAPCEDMMGSWALRVCVWAVVILTVFGNAAVLFVLVASRKSMDVPQFLVCNLAFADLCLGVYLAFISVVDLQTQGNGRFYLSAIPWQNGPGCKTAGFFAIFATELSVYSLVLITFERLYTISNVMKKKQIGIKMAVLLVGIGWVIAIITALLPLLNVGVNSYSSVCVCLPFLHEGIGDRLYLIFIVTFNLLAFVLIVAFYVRIYWLTRKTQAVNSGPSDRKLIRSILMLTIVDFLCWVPLSVITLAVVGGKSDILDISVSKWLVVLIFPINACANPFLYAIFTKKFREHIKTLVCCSNKSNFPFRPNQYQSRDQQRPQYAQRRASISIAEFHRRLSTSSLEMSSQQRARSNSIQPLLNHYSGNTSVMSSSDHTSMTSVGSSILHHGRRSSLPSTLLTTPPQRDGSHAPSLSQDSEIQYLNGVYTHLVPPINFSRSGSLPNLNEEESVGHASLSHRTLSPNEHHPPLATLMEASNENVPGMELGPSRESRSHGKVGHGEGEGQREEDASLVRSEDSRDADMDQKPTRVHTSPSTDSGHVTNFKASTSCSSHLSTRSSPLPTLSPPATPPHVSECLFNRSPVYGREPTDGFDSSALCHGLHSLWTKEHGLERPDHTDTTPSPPGLPNATPMPVTSDCTTTVNGDVVSGYYSNTTVYLKSPPYPYNALEWEDMETDV